MKKDKKKVIGLTIVLAAVAIGVYFYTRPKEVTNYDTRFESEQEKPQSEASQGGTEEGIQIPAGKKEVSVELTNPEENKVYFKISFYLPETDETIYTSKLIKPGQHLYDITLKKEMEAGEYPLVVKYATCSADEKRTPRNSAEVNCTLVVK